MAALAEEAGSNPSTYSEGSWPSVTPVPDGPMLSSDLHGHQASIQYTYIHVDNHLYTHIHEDSHLHT